MILFVVGVCTAIAYLCVVFFEMPIVQLEKLLFASLGINKLPTVRREVKQETKEK